MSDEEIYDDPEGYRSISIAAPTFRAFGDEDGGFHICVFTQEEDEIVGAFESLDPDDPVENEMIKGLRVVAHTDSAVNAQNLVDYLCAGSQALHERGDG